MSRTSPSAGPALRRGRPVLSALLGGALCAASVAQADEAPEAVAIRLLSARHAPSCARVLTVLGDDADEHLVRLAEQPATIPWVPIRAAACLVRRPGLDDAVARWAAQPERRGLVVTVLDHLEALPAQRAVQVAELVLATPSGDAFRTILADSRVEAVRARVAQSE